MHTETNDTQPASDTQPARPVAALLIATSVLALAAISHHPTTAAVDPQGIAHEIAHESAVNRVVHGSLILIVLVWWLAMRSIAELLGPDSLPRRATLLAYAFGASAMTVAAATSGFLAPALASLYAHQPEGIEHHMRFAWALNQTASWFGALGIGLGSAGLAALLLGRSRALGVIGLTATAGPLLYLLYILLRGGSIGVLEVGVFAAGIGVWNTTAAVWLLTAKR